MSRTTYWNTRGILQRRFTASNTLNVIYVTSNWLLYIYSVGTHRNMKGIVVKVQERTFCLTNYNMSSCDQIYVVSSVWSIYSFVVDLHSLKECNGRLVNRVVPIYSTDGATGLTVQIFTYSTQRCRRSWDLFTWFLQKKTHNNYAKNPMLCSSLFKHF